MPQNLNDNQAPEGWDSLPGVPLSGIYYPDSQHAYRDHFEDIMALRAESYRIQADSLTPVWDSTYSPSPWGEIQEYKVQTGTEILSPAQKHLEIGYSLGLAASLLFAALSILSFQPRLKRYLQTLFNNSALNEFVEEEYHSWTPPFFLLYLAASLVITTLAVHYLAPREYLQTALSYTATSGILLGSLLLLPILRAICILLLGSIFRFESFSWKHILLSYNTQIILGMLLLPFFVTALIFPEIPPEWGMYLVLGLTGSCVLYQIIRLTRAGVGQNLASAFYTLLYLVSIEIIPLLLIFKTFQP